MVIRSHIEYLTPLRHGFQELLLIHGHPDTEIEKHVLRRSVTGSLPVARVRDIYIGVRVVHITSDMKNGAFG